MTAHVLAAPVASKLIGKTIGKQVYPIARLRFKHVLRKGGAALKVAYGLPIGRELNGFAVTQNQAGNVGPRKVELPGAWVEHAEANVHPIRNFGLLVARKEVFELGAHKVEGIAWRIYLALGKRLHQQAFTQGA